MFSFQIAEWEIEFDDTTFRLKHYFTEQEVG
jgi:hypothetical protein